MKRVALIAAMPGELAPLVKNWRRAQKDGVQLWFGKLGSVDCVAACGGAGMERAVRAVAAAGVDQSFAAVVSLGWVGALDHGCEPGMVYAVSEIVNVRTGERYAGLPKGMAGCRLATVSAVADHTEKQRLKASYHAVLVDMEAAAVARLAEIKGVPFYCIKAVSDGVDEQLPDFNRFIDARGQFRFAAFVVHALMRPWYWPSLIRMGENSKRAAVGMARTVQALIAAEVESAKHDEC